MFEILPIAAGFLFAIALLRWGPRASRTRWVTSGVFAVVVGIAVSAISGELAESWGFAVLDTALTLLAIAVTMVALRTVVQPAEERRTI
jgi:hypothetical protein